MLENPPYLLNLGLRGSKGWSKISQLKRRDPMPPPWPTLAIANRFSRSIGLRSRDLSMRTRRRQLNVALFGPRHMSPTPNDKYNQTLFFIKR
eukprot:6459899-Amphidinium_carterae.1